MVLSLERDLLRKLDRPDRYEFRELNSDKYIIFLLSSCFYLKFYPLLFVIAYVVHQHDDIMLNTFVLDSHIDYNVDEKNRRLWFGEY
jgi:hypothetical protein